MSYGSNTWLAEANAKNRPADTTDWAGIIRRPDML
jgi:hypothetical protein